MAVGSYNSCTKRDMFRKMFAKVFGTPDYHSHIRLRPVIRECGKRKVHGKFLEVGCGSGTVAFELWIRGHINSYTGIDLNPEAIGWARETGKSLGADRMSFVDEDAFTFLDSADTGGGNVFLRDGWEIG